MITGTTRDPNALSRAITTRDRFKTSGALRGEYSEINDTYTVWSYNEPIAVIFYPTDSALASTRKWSRTTTKHQSTTRRALAALDIDLITETDAKMFAHSTRTL